jgi:RNA polymerase sigma-70 factor (ECF subfamily)
MAHDQSENSATTQELLRQARAGDQRALNNLFTQHRERLQLMVRLRLDRRLQGRLDPSDVIQEAYIEALERFADYVQDPDMPFFLWLRFLTAQKLLVLHRRHLGAHMRAAGREMSLYRGALPEVSSAELAARLLGHHTTPSQAAMRAERQIRLQEALNSMDPLDREVLALRHFEQLTNSETAKVLGLRESAASQRYARALLRLKEILTSLPGGLEGIGP